MFWVDEVVTRKKVSIVFDNGDIPAGLPKNTQCMLLSKGCSGSLLDDLYFKTANIPTHPLIEDCAEKRTEGFSRHRALADAVFARPSVTGRRRLDQGQKS